MAGETQGQSHQISNVSIGPDGKLYVHMGDGFDPATAVTIGHQGLVNMRERAAGIGATMTIESDGATGTTVRVRLPDLGTTEPDGRREA